MDSDTKSSAKNAGIVFSDVHSDEPHEAVQPKVLEALEKKADHPSHLSSSGGVFNVEKAFKDTHHEEGTILKDTRRHRMGLFESIKMAGNEWMGKVQKNVSSAQQKIAQARAAETSKIAPAETRKEIIEKAATFTAMPPKDDVPVVIAKIRTFKTDVERLTAKPIIKPAEERAATWSHTETPNETPVPPTPIPPPKIQTSPEASTTKTPTPSVAPVIEKNIATPKSTPTPLSPVPGPKIAAAIFPDMPRVRNEEKPHATIAPVITTAPKRSLGDTVAPPVSPMKARPAPSAPTPSWSTPEQPPTERQYADRIPLNLPIHSQDPFRSIEEKPEEISREMLKHTVSQMLNPEGEPSVTIQTQEPHREVPETPSPAPEGGAAPEFRSAPIPSNVKQEFREFQNQAKNRPAKKVRTAPSSRISHYLFRGTILFTGTAVAAVLIMVIRSEFAQPVTRDPIIETPESFTPSFETTKHATPLILEGNRETYLYALQDAIHSAPAGLSEMYPMVNEGSVSRAATTEELLTFLNVGLEANVTRALNPRLVMGSITTITNEPFMILRSSNFDLLFTGMIAWEQSLQTDLAPLFGVPLVPAKPFTDAVRENAPARILYDDAGNELLVYAFTREHMVVITSSSEALSALLEHF